MATRNIFNADASNERESQQNVNELSKAYKEAAKAAGLLTDEERELLGLSQQLELSLQNIIASKVLRNNESRSSKKITEEIRNLEKSRLEQEKIGLNLTSKLNQQIREQRIERVNAGREINKQNILISNSQNDLLDIQSKIYLQNQNNLYLEQEKLKALRNQDYSLASQLGLQIQFGNHNLKTFKDKVDTLAIWVTEKQLTKFWKDAGHDGKSEWVNMEVSNNFKKAHPQLNRDMAAEVLEFIYNSDKPVLLKDDSSFIEDGLFCEWAYIIDLDKNTLTVKGDKEKSYSLLKLPPVKKIEKDCQDND